MQSLSDHRALVDSAGVEDWPFRVVDLHRDLEIELSHPDVLLGVTDKFLTIAREHSCDAVVGASHLGGQLAGAVVARAANGLRLFSASYPSGKVLVVDGLLATGTQVVRAVQEAKRAGARHAVVAVVLGSHKAISHCREEIQSHVLALEEF